MKTVILKAKTQKGKARIAQHGDRWEVVDRKPFMGSDAIQIRSLHETFFLSPSNTIKDTRWVMKPVDPDFEIMEN